MLRFFFLFLFLLTAMFVFELTPMGQEWVVVPWTSVVAAVSSWLVQIFDPEVIAYGKILRDQETGFAVSIEAGCNGIEATIVLFAAMLAFPAPLKNKIIGLLIGFLALHALNLVRVISLFYIGQWNMTVFEWAHLYLWQALIMLDALVVFLIWLRTLPKDSGPSDDPEPSPA